MLLLFRQKHFKPIRIDLFDYPTYLIIGRRFIVEAHHQASKKNYSLKVRGTLGSVMMM